MEKQLQGTSSRVVSQPKLLLKKKNVLSRDKLFKYLCWGSALCLGVTLFAIVLFISKTGFLVFKDVSIKEFFLSSNWQPENEHYGAAVFIIGTFCLTALALVIAAPVSVLMAVFLAEVAPQWLRNLLRPVFDLLVGIPSIVYGYLGATILVPFIREVTGTLVGDGFFAASLVLALMVLPTITRISDDAITAVPSQYKDGSYALGATKIQTIFKIILPVAKKGIMTAIILGMARAIGETMAVVMVIGNTPQFGFNLVTPTSVLTSNIVMQIINVQFDSTWNYALYMMAFILLFISLVLIFIIRKLEYKS
ncbi:phosphate ABC transporter permease subunit PstC [Priestia koreensis]|uniref:phosphate ABC transporter permease subunit PstC n=1 Tax=Priestia koreensis TaxID=284581 RepID=UPI0034577842